MPAAPSASLRKASLRALSAAAFWRPLPSFSAAAFSAATFQPRPFRRPPSRQQPFRRRPSWRRLPSSRRRSFRLRPFPQRPSRRQPCQPWRSCSRRFFPSARPACALPPGAPFPWRPRRLRAFSSSSRFFLACCSAISGSTSDLGGWTLGSGGGGEDPAASAARVPVAAWLRLGFGRFGRGRRRNGRIAVRPELHFHRAGRFRAPVQVEDQHGQQQRAPTRPEAGLSGCQCWAAWPGPLRCRMMGGVMGVACRRAGGRASR